MKPENLLRNSIILLLLVAVGIASRFVLVDVPNFKPVAAIALFAAFWFRSYWVAGLSMVLVMLVSNTGLEQCPWQVTTGVLVGLMIAAFLGQRLRTNFESSQHVTARPLSALSQLLGTTFVMSIAFFVISNFAVWAMGQWYPVTFGGLVHCFTAAIPFFKYTFGGDLFFAGSIFAAWYVLETGYVFQTRLAASSK